MGGILHDSATRREARFPHTAQRIKRARKRRALKRRVCKPVRRMHVEMRHIACIVSKRESDHKHPNGLYMRRYLRRLQLYIVALP